MEEEHHEISTTSPREQPQGSTCAEDGTRAEKAAKEETVDEGSWTKEEDHRTIITPEVDARVDEERAMQ